jgi:hypothetical protein
MLGELTWSSHLRIIIIRTAGSCASSLGQGAHKSFRISAAAIALVSAAPSIDAGKSIEQCSPQKNRFPSR